MNAIIFYSVAEYCDYSTKLTVKQKNNQVRIEIWDSSKEDIDVQTKTFLTKKKAYKDYRTAIGDAILGGWKVLNVFPKRETWETKRSK